MADVIIEDAATFVEIPAAFAPPACDQILAEASELPARAGLVYQGRIGIVDPAQYAATERFVPWPWVLRRLQRLLDTAATPLGLAAPRLVEVPRLVTYVVGGHFGWHQDASPEASGMPGRRITGVVPLALPDSYDGGALEIAGTEPTTASRHRGTTILFPAHVRHRVTPVTRGVRHALVFWGY